MGDGLSSSQKCALQETRLKVGIGARMPGRSEVTPAVVTEPSIITPGVSPGADDGQLGFALNFMSGRGLLTLRDRAFGSVSIKLLELEIPHIAFPFDVTGGADRFKNHHCRLRHLVFGVDSQGLVLALRRSDLSGAGFVELKSAIRDGFVEFAGRFAVGEHQADFTFRAAFLLRSQEEANVVFYDTPRLRLATCSLRSASCVSSQSLTPSL